MTPSLFCCIIVLYYKTIKGCYMMARKLTPQELQEAHGADFVEPFPLPGKQKHAGGRPQKGAEKLKVCSFRLTDHDYRKLKAVAASRGVSAGDLIAGFVATLPDHLEF